MYKQMSAAFEHCRDDTLGARPRKHVCIRPKGFDMAMYYNGQLLLTVDKDDTLTFQAFIKTLEQFRAINSIIQRYSGPYDNHYHRLQRSHLVKHHASQFRYNGARMAPGLTCTNDGELDGITPDPERIMNESQRQEVNKRIPDLASRIWAYIQLAWNKDAYGKYVITQNLPDDTATLEDALMRLFDGEIQDKDVVALLMGRYAAYELHTIVEALNKHKRTYFRLTGIEQFREKPNEPDC